MVSRNENPVDNSCDPHPLSETVLGILESADVSEAVGDQVANAIEAFLTSRAYLELVENRDAEIKRLRARLECGHVFQIVDGAMVRIEQDVPEEYDGIACRDETIRQQDRRIKELVENRGGGREGDGALTLADLTGAPSMGSIDALAACKGEQEHFEKWAARESYELTEHPLHYLFLDSKTYAARDGWRAALTYARSVLADCAPSDTPKVTQSNSVREETIEECAKVADDAKNAATVMMAQTTEGPARYYLRSRGAEFAARKIGESIRALLSPTDSGSVGKGEVNE